MITYESLVEAIKKKINGFNLEEGASVTVYLPRKYFLILCCRKHARYEKKQEICYHYGSMFNLYDNINVSYLINKDRIGYLISNGVRHKYISEHICSIKEV